MNTHDEKIGQVMPGVFDVLISADLDAPNEVYVDVHQCTYGPLLSDKPKIRQAKTGEYVYGRTVPASDAEWKKALEVDRWFMIEPDDPEDEVKVIPAELRRFADIALDWHRQTQTP